MLIYYSNIL